MQLTLLRAFEAAARTGSFQEAAVELHLSPSAISHAIRKLEQSLGAVLFEREGRKARLSVDGKALIRHIGPAFDDIRRGVSLVSTRGPKVLRVHSAPSFAAQWLTPRLPQFLAAHPDIEIRLSAGTDYTRFTTDEFDVDIVYGRQDQEGVVVLPLGEEAVTPLCTPKFASLILKPEDLLRHALIDSDNKQIRWPDWFAANGLSAPPPHGMRFDRSFLAISAAASGLGVALESTRLAEREIADGRLVPILSGKSVDVRYVGHFLVFPRIAVRRQTLQIFRRWIVSELGLPVSSSI
ncbi:LysR substrate-binding domain-containing protein [Taklimakanibacter lacteus]|uniref:LysR substrate-binding domain-containing protein n=1 Tax=Taklimakanibacter lacteus TaxID=2268456 RepID=UPI000E666CE9